MVYIPQSHAMAILSTNHKTQEAVLCRTQPQLPRSTSWPPCRRTEAPAGGGPDFLAGGHQGAQPRAIGLVGTLHLPFPPRVFLLVPHGLKILGFPLFGIGRSVSEYGHPAGLGTFQGLGSATFPTARME
jgi:hypothetical protein